MKFLINTAHAECRLEKYVMKTICFLLFYLLVIPLGMAVNLFDNNVYRSLIADKRAYLPGDLLTVIVLENANAQSSTDLASGKDIETGIEASYNKNRHEVSLGLKGHGRATAKTGRNGKIKASLTVRIKSIQTNGSYVVEGSQLIRINGEQQAILLSGIVRPEDISAQNTLLSTRLADAQITYSGNGSVSDSQRHNYLYNVMAFMGLV